LLHWFGAGSDLQGVSGISEGLHAKMSMFTRRKSTSTISYLGSRVALMLNASPLGRWGRGARA
jgi:hypothetical protein